MKQMRRWLGWGLGWLTLLTAGLGMAQPLPLTEAEEMGFSPERLERLHGFLQQLVDTGKHAGGISLIAREGKIVDWQAYGYADLAAKQPMAKDTICRIYSMSKLVTSVAVLMLFEQGRFGLDDPIERYLPEYKEMKVFKGGTAEAPELEPAKSPITVKQLLTHTSGLIYDFGETPLEQIYRKADLWEATSLEEFSKRAARLPLAHQPGTAWTYGINTDVLGRLVEVVSGQRFEAFLQERLFGPLGMVDTGFDVPESKRGRLAHIYESGPDGKLREAKPILGAYAEAGRGFASGGAGLFSTIGDYARLGQMLLNGGQFDEIHFLGRKTVELMMANHLNHLERPTMAPNGAEGFGLGGSVRIDLAKGGNLGSLGQFGWSGAATTYFNLDPEEGTMVLLFFQHFPYDQHGVFPRFSTLFYQALVE